MEKKVLLVILPLLFSTFFFFFQPKSYFGEKYKEFKEFLLSFILRDAYPAISILTFLI